MSFKVQKIRVCRQCGDMMPLDCAKCKKHPERKPHIIEVYELPPILKVAECGCCIQIECQLPKEHRPHTCKKLMWRPRSIARLKKNMYCSIGVGSCAAIASSLSRDKRVFVTCSNESCDRGKDGKRNSILREQCRLKNYARSFCCRSCRSIQDKRENHKAHDQMIAKNRIERATDRVTETDKMYGKDIALQSLYCKKCREVTDHTRQADGLYACGCGGRQNGAINMAMTGLVRGRKASDFTAA